MPDHKSDSLAWGLVIILSLLLVIAVVIIFLLYRDQKAPVSLPPKPFPLPSVSVISPTPQPRIIILNKEFLFPIYGPSSSQINNFSLVIKSIERTKEVTIAGQKATAVGDRELVILNLELTNPDKFAARVYARNYFRLRSNGQEKLFAPEYHSDPIDLQPVSTQELRMGFSIAQTDTDLQLLVGELDKTPQVINIE